MSQLMKSEVVGWTLVASAIFWVLQLIFVSTMYATWKMVFGALSDFSNAVTVLLMLPFAFALFGANQPHSTIVSVVALVAGVAGILAVAIPSILIILNIMSFEQTLPPIMAGFAAIGIWLALNFWLVRAQASGPPAIVNWGLVIGLGLASFGFLLIPLSSGVSVTGGDWRALLSNPFVYPALTIGLVGYLGYPVWAFIVGRMVTQLRLDLFVN